jgi:hypothetical protein
METRLEVKRFFIIVGLMMLSFNAQAAGFDYGQWDSLLKKHVIQVSQGPTTQVDYDGFLADHAKLKTFLEATSAVKQSTFDSWNKNEQLAFLINAYNAWTIELVLSGYPVKSIKDLGSLLKSPWKKSFIPLLGKTRSLDDIEQGLIRSNRYQEPRIHFAVNCASIGCPALRTEAYAAENLTKQLDDAAQMFLKDRTRNRFEDGKLKLSSIFKWYKNDFERGWSGFKSLPQFLSSYSQALGLNENDVQRLQAGEIDIDYLDYNWQLNRKQ